MLQSSLGRADCGHFKIAMGKEWLVTNGLGGYASGTISGAHTRRYHGLLVAALRPPLERTVLVAKVDTTAYYGDEIYPLFANEFAAGAESVFLVTESGSRLISKVPVEVFVC